MINVMAEAEISRIKSRIITLLPTLNQQLMLLMPQSRNTHTRVLLFLNPIR